jgi:hypothetical protein
MKKSAQIDKEESCATPFPEGPVWCKSSCAIALFAERTRLETCRNEKEHEALKFR